MSTDNADAKICLILIVGAVVAIAIIATAVVFKDFVNVHAGLCSAPYKYVLNGTEFSKDVWAPCKPLTAEAIR